MHVLRLSIAVVLATASVTAQQPFYSHDNYTQYELLDPSTNQFAITYFLTERRAGATVVLNQTRSGSAGSDIAVFDPQTGKPLKFDYLTGEQLAKDGTAGRFDPAEHYIRAQLPRPVPEGGEGRVKILKTYKDEKSYYLDGDDIVFRRSLGIARNSIVLPKGYRLASSNVAAQILTLADGRLKISFEHAHGYASDVTIRGRKGPALTSGSIRSERSFDFTKVLYDLSDSGDVRVTREIIVSTPGSTAFVANQMAASDVVVVDVDTGAKLELTAGREGRVARLLQPITGPGETARLRLTGMMRNRYTVADGQFNWTTRVDEPRATFVMPPTFDVAAVSVPATVTSQQDGRVVVQIYSGAEVPLSVTIRGVKR